MERVIKESLRLYPVRPRRFNNHFQSIHTFCGSHLMCASLVLPCPVRRHPRDSHAKSKLIKWYVSPPPSTSKPSYIPSLVFSTHFAYCHLVTRLEACWSRREAQCWPVRMPLILTPSCGPTLTFSSQTDSETYVQLLQLYPMHVLK
jgi:hypothetical protein